MKILKLLTCMTSKTIAVLIDSGSFLKYIRVSIFIPTTLAFTAFFNYKINKLQQTIGGGADSPQPPASDGPLMWKVCTV